jgi:cell division protein ZapA
MNTGDFNLANISVGFVVLKSSFRRASVGLFYRKNLYLIELTTGRYGEKNVNKYKPSFQHMQELIPVNIIIGDRSYRIRIDPSDEETVRRTVKLINEKLLEFKTNFAGKDMQDYVAMVLLWYATEQVNTADAGVEKPQANLLSAFQDIEAQLDQAIG